MTSRDEIAYEETLEYQRALWCWCAETVAMRWCRRHHGGAFYSLELARCPTGGLIQRLLIFAIDDVPDLDVLIRKVEPDIPSFEEGRMSLAERYRW